MSLFDGQAHPIHAYGIDSAGGANAQLTGSPKSLTCAAAASGVRRHVVDPTSFEAWKLDLFWDAPPLGDAEIGKLTEASAWPSAPELVQADDGSPEVWLVDGKWRRHVPSPAVMAAWSLSFDAVKKVPAAEVAALWEGPKLRARPVIVKAASGKIDMLDDALPTPGTAVKQPTPEEAGWGGGAGVSGKPTGSAKRASDAGDVGASCATGPRPPAGSAGWLLLAGALVPLRRRGRG